MPHHFQFEPWVPFPTPRIFAFFSDPNNLPRIMPPATETRLEQLRLIAPSPDLMPSAQTAGIGTIIVTSFRPFPFLPFRAKWVARIIEFEWNRYFADVQQKGPFKRWHHRHEFSPETREGAGGTLVRDVIEYEVGFGPLGALGDKLLIARGMHDTFAQRQKVLPGLLSGSEAFTS
jgi:ligand-binding SRPBCC domain-containing protein